ncbi:hypothetical protein AB3N02_22240 [Priestia aryabhattai]|uniref:hypothetical protein n=1 Tax=Priestia aryabhattai TaxID=412384 RepID=UPI00399FFCE1
MTWLRDEAEVDKMIEDMKNRTKGKYITQGVSFNKSCPRQMALLKKALMASASFSGLGKEVLALHFSGHQMTSGSTQQGMSQGVANNPPKTKNIGNFL